MPKPSPEDVAEFQKYLEQHTVPLTEGYEGPQALRETDIKKIDVSAEFQSAVNDALSNTGEPVSIEPLRGLFLKSLGQKGEALDAYHQQRAFWQEVAKALRPNVFANLYEEHIAPAIIKSADGQASFDATDKIISSEIDQAILKLYPDIKRSQDEYAVALQVVRGEFDKFLPPEVREMMRDSLGESGRAETRTQAAKIAKMYENAKQWEPAVRGTAAKQENQPSGQQKEPETKEHAKAEGEQTSEQEIVGKYIEEAKQEKGTKAILDYQVGKAHRVWLRNKQGLRADLDNLLKLYNDVGANSKAAQIQDNASAEIKSAVLNALMAGIDDAHKMYSKYAWQNVKSGDFNKAKDYVSRAVFQWAMLEKLKELRAFHQIK